MKRRLGRQVRGITSGKMESRIELQRDDRAPQRIFRSTGIIYRVDKRYVNSAHHAALSVPDGQVPGFP
jgi:hypothetical protein